MWAQEGAWEHFPWYLLSYLSQLWRDLCELNWVHGTTFCGSSPYPPPVWVGREPRGLKRVHGNVFHGTSSHLSVGYAGSFVSSIGCIGPLSMVPPLILYQFGGEPCGLERVHRNAFCNTSLHPPLTKNCCTSEMGHVGLQVLHEHIGRAFSTYLSCYRSKLQG